MAIMGRGVLFNRSRKTRAPGRGDHAVLPGIRRPDPACAIPGQQKVVDSVGLSRQAAQIPLQRRRVNFLKTGLR
jgi:hypothetical protein